MWTCETCSGGNPVDAAFCGHCGTERAGTEAARQGEERRLVTALFADISGFTTLSEQLDDPEALHEVIAPVISGMAAIAERYDGFIAKYAGDALLVFFGAPVAHEDDAARALLVALEMQSALPSLLEDLPPMAAGLELHIGVNTGRVISGQFGGDLRNDYSILGDSVILAQRLESVAPNGQIFVGQSTYELTSDAFAFESVGELQLKGKLKQVPAWRLLGRKAVAAATPTRVGPVIGRTRELAAIDAMVHGLAQARGGGLVAVAGEPGVGKSRLLAEARARADDQGVQWLQARCLAYGAALPYWPYAELVRAITAIGPTDAADAARARLASAPGVTPATLPYLARLIGATTRPGELPNEPEELQRRLHEAVTDWLVALATERPTVLAIEDVHWIDSASAALTAHLARVSHGWPIALVLTARPEGQPVVRGIGAAVDEAWRAEFEIGPLDHDAVVVYVTSILDGEPPPELVRVVEERTGGNPLFVGELVRSLLEQEALVRRNDRWRMRPGWSPGDVPDTVERVLTSRIDLLPPEQSALLQTASVIGRLVRLPLLHAVVDEPDVDDRLHALARAGLLDEARDGLEPAYLFHHALVQDVAYERLLRRNRRELHRRVAEAAETLYGTGDDVVDLLARHSFLGERAEAVPYLARAGQRARSLYANDEAIVHLERALALVTGDDPRHDELIAALADLRNHAADYDTALELYRQLGSLHGRIGEADVLRKLGRYDDALAVCDAEVARHGGEAASAGLWHQRGMILGTLGRFPEAIDALRQGVIVAEDDAVLEHLVIALMIACCRSGITDDALQYGLLAARMCARRGDTIPLTAALRGLGDVYDELGRYDDAADALRQGLRLAERTGAAEEVGGILLTLGVVEQARGDLVAAIACDRRAVAQFERIDHGTGRAVAYGNLACKLRGGDASEAVEWARRALAVAEEIGHTGTLADASATLAEALLEVGDVAAALAAARAAQSRFSDMGNDEEAARCRSLAEAAGAT